MVLVHEAVMRVFVCQSIEAFWQGISGFGSSWNGSRSIMKECSGTFEYDYPIPALYMQSPEI